MTDTVTKPGVVQKSGHSGERVTVACKLPNGLVLHLDKMVKKDVPMFGGGFKTIEIAEQVGDTIRLNGNAVPPKVRPEFLIIGEYALTSDVPKDFWEAWLSQNKDTAIVRRKLVFAYDRLGDATAAAREMTETKSGLEPLNTEFRTSVINGRQQTRPVDPRYPSGIRTGDRERDAA